MISPFDTLRLWGLWNMLQSYFSLYELALDLQARRNTAEAIRSHDLSDFAKDDFRRHLETIQRVCIEYGFTHTADLAKRSMQRPPGIYADILSVLNHLNDSLSHELEKESVVRIPPDRKGYFEQNHLFGAEISAAFPSCAEDIKRAGSCYALGQGDASIHHLMLVLERGLHSLAVRVGVSFHHTNWQVIIDGIAKELKSLPRGVQRDFYNEVNSQFGYLKNTYRNHSEHVHDVPYDLETSLSTLNHVRSFMRALEKGGLKE